MRSFGLVILLAGIAGCATHNRPATAVSGFDCWPSPLSEPVLRKARKPDPALRESGESGLLVVVDSSQSKRRMENVLVSLVGKGYGARTDSTGTAVLMHLAPGENRLRVARIGYDSWDGYV